VTRGRLPQRVGLPGLNGGGAAATVRPMTLRVKIFIAPAILTWSCSHHSYQIWYDNPSQPDNEFKRSSPSVPCDHVWWPCSHLQNCIRLEVKAYHFQLSRC